MGGGHAPSPSTARPSGSTCDAARRVPRRWRPSRSRRRTCSATRRPGRWPRPVRRGAGRAPARTRSSSSIATTPSWSPAATAPAPRTAGTRPVPRRPATRSRRPYPTPRPSGGIQPQIARLEIRFFDDPAALAAAFRAGEVDAASGLDPAAAAPLGACAGARGSSATRRRRSTAVVLNLRPATIRSSRDPRTRTRPARRDRPGADHDGRLRRAGDARRRPDRRRPRGRSTRPPARRSAATWRRPRSCSRRPAGRRRGRLASRRTRRSRRRSSCSSPTATRTRALYAAGTQVAADWTALGLRPSRSSRPTRPSSPPTTSGPASSAAAIVDIASATTRTSIRCSPRARPGPAAPTSSGSRIRLLDDLLEAARKPGRGRGPEGRLRRPPDAARRRAPTSCRSPGRTTSSWLEIAGRGPSIGPSPTGRSDFGMC